MTQPAQWCVIVIRGIPCIDNHGKNVLVEYPVTVWGPFAKAEAEARADRFNATHRETEEGAPVYRPVDNAPSFLNSEDWDEHWAIVRPMNDIAI